MNRRNALLPVFVLLFLLAAAAPVAAQWTENMREPLGFAGASRGAVWGDADNDGDIDLYIVNDTELANVLARNLLADRTDYVGFTGATAPPLDDEGTGQGAAWGDYDDDGDLDLALVNDGGPDRIFRNEGGLTFTEVFATAASAASRGVAWVDTDDDGDLDLFVTVFEGPNRVLINDGGVFVETTPAAPLGETGPSLGAAWSDMDNDGDLDVYLVLMGSANRLLRNDGGAFTDITAGPLGDAGAGVSAAWADFDNDGDPDLYLTNRDGANRLFRNDGGVFVDVASGPEADAGNGAGAAWLDFDLDGRLDLYLVNQGPNRLLRNTGAGFDDVTSGPEGNADAGEAVAVADENLDGDPDLYLTNGDGPNRLLKNGQSTGHNWLHVEFLNAVGPRAPLGARLRLVADGLAQLREITGGDGALSNQALEALFGLGDAALVDTLEIRWASGLVETFTNLVPNQSVNAYQLATADTDGDGVLDGVDACPLVAPATGEVDRDFDGCPDVTSSFRFVKFWSEDQLPVFYETDATGDPRIGDGSDFAEIAAGFEAWTLVPGVTLGGGDDGTQAGPAIVTAGDRRNSITFSDPTGYIPGVLAITPTTTVTGDTVIGGRAFRPGEIVDADMLFNAAQFSFSTPSFPGETGAFDLRALATHEFGHFIGISHSPVRSHTMFYVVPPGAGPRSLEEDDLEIARRGYASVEPALTVEGRILRGDGATPIPGAAVFAISDATGDSLQVTVSGIDGVYRFFEVSESFRIRVQPLDGGPEVNGLVPGAVNTLLAGVAETDFLGEFWDGAAETNDDFGAPGQVVSVPGPPVTGADIIVNPDLTGPQVVSTTPANGVPAAPAVGAILVKFDEKIDLASVAGPPSGLSLTNLATASNVGGSAALLQYDSLLVFTPATALDYDTDYELTVGPTITDIFGNPMTAPVTVSFTVETQPPLVLASVSPPEVPVGAQVVLAGTGFDPVPGNNLVTFTGGVTAVPFAGGVNTLTVVVPPGAITGNVTVTAGATPSNAVVLEVLDPKDPAKGNLVGTLPLPGAPRQVAVVPGGDWAYVATAAGVTAVDAVPASAGFLDAVDLPVAGGSPGVAPLPSGLRAVALGSAPPLLHEIDTDPASAAFNSFVRSVGVADEPLGVEVLPGGAEMLIAYTDRVVLHSAAEGPLFGQELRQWTAPGVVFTGYLAVSPSGQEAYATTGDGRAAVLGLQPGENVVGFLTAGPTPRDLASVPDGSGFLGVDAEGTMRSFGPRGPLQHTLSLDGGFSGLAVPPAGGCAFAANFTLNRVDIIAVGPGGLDALDSFSTGVDPRDLALGSAGRYVYVVTDAQDRLEIYDTADGPLVTSVSPSAAGAGVLVTVAGSGFSPVASENVVYLGGEAHEPVLADPAGHALVVRLSPTAGDGPARVESNGLSSNSIPFATVNRPDPGVFERGPDLATGGPQPDRLLETPDGALLIALHGDGSMTVNAVRPGEPEFLRPLQVLAPVTTELAGPAPMAVTPDGKKLYVIDPPGGGVAVFSVDPSLAEPVARTGIVSEGAGVTGLYSLSDLAVTPDGRRLFTTSLEDNALFEVDVVADTVLAEIGTFSGSPLPVAVHPAGRVVYVGDNNDLPRINAVDIDPDSPGYRQVTSTLGLPGDAGPHQLIARRDGGTVLALVDRAVAATQVFSLEAVGADSAAAGFHTVVGSGDVAQDVQPTVIPNHSGTLLYILDPEALAVDAYDAATLSPVDTGPASTQLAATRSLALSRDDARLFMPGFGDLVLSHDLSDPDALAGVSGLNQIGVAGLPLPAPLVFKNTGVVPPLAEGGFITFSTPGGGDFGFGDGRLFAAADEDGLAQASYATSPAAGIDSVVVESAAGSILLEIPVLPDTAAAPPQVISVAPDGSGVNPPGVTTPVAVDFSKSIDPASVSGASFALRSSGGAGSLPGVYSFAYQQRRVVFKPTAPLDPASSYDIVLADGLTDTEGHPLANPSVTTFTTAVTLPLQIHSVDAPAARLGTPVVLSGHGFGLPATANIVLFSGGTAAPLEGDPDALLVTVPPGAGTGPVRVVVGPDTTNALVFTVLPPPGPPVNQTLAEIDVPSSGQQIAVVPDGSRAYMTAPALNAVVPIEIVGQVSEPAVGVGLHPFGVVSSPNGDRVYVTNFFSHDVSVIDADPAHATFQQVIAVIPAGLNPTGIAAHPDGRTIYVVNYGDSTLTVVDTDTTSAAAYSARATVPTDANGKSVVVSPDGGRIIVGTATGLLIIDANDVSARQALPVDTGTQSVTITPDGGLAVVLATNGEVLLIDIVPGSPTEGQARAALPTDKNGKSVAVSPDGAFVYVTDDEGFVSVFQIVVSGGGAAVAGPPGSPYELVELPPVAVGENPVGLAFDPSGSGLLAVVNAGSETVSLINASDEPVGVRADLEITPDPLRFIHDELYFNARLEFPPGLDPELLVFDSVRMADVLEPVPGQGGPGDFDGNSIPDYLVRFNRLQLLELFPEGDRLALTVTGTVGNTPFTAADTIDVNRMGVLAPAPQQMVTLGAPVEIRWASVAGAPDHTVDILWSADGGDTWDVVVQGTEDDSLHVWTPEGQPSEDCLVRVEMRDEQDRLMSFGVMSGPFTLAATTGEPDRPLPARFGLLPASPNPFRSGTAIRFDLPEPAPVTVRIFALDGSLVRVLAEDRDYPAGSHRLAWDGADRAGRRVGAGVYFLRITAGPEHAARKIVKVN